MRPRLVLPPAERARIEAWCRAEHPREACGLLIGFAEDGATLVIEAARARNLTSEDAGERYFVDPVDQLAAELRAQELGMAVVGVWHSHLDRPAQPSATDRERAYEGYSYLILSVTAERIADLRSFRLEHGRLVEEELDGEPGVTGSGASRDDRDGPTRPPA